MTATRVGSDFPTGSNSLTAAATIPVGTVAGSLIVAIYTVTGTHPNAGSTGIPAGFAYRGDTDQVAHSSNLSQWVYTKTATGGDAGATVTSGATSTATRQTMAIVVYSDDAGGTLDFESLTVDVDSTPGTATSVAAQTFGISGGCVRNTGVETWTPPAGWTEVGESHTDNGTGGKSSEINEKLAYVSAGTNLGGITLSASAGTIGGSWVLIAKNTPAATGNTTNFLSHL